MIPRCQSTRGRCALRRLRMSTSRRAPPGKPYFPPWIDPKLCGTREVPVHLRKYRPEWASDEFESARAAGQAGFSAMERSCALRDRGNSCGRPDVRFLPVSRQASLPWRVAGFAGRLCRCSSRKLPGTAEGSVPGGRERQHVSAKRVPSAGMAGMALPAQSPDPEGSPWGRPRAPRREQARRRDGPAARAPVPAVHLVKSLPGAARPGPSPDAARGRAGARPEVTAGFPIQGRAKGPPATAGGGDPCIGCGRFRPRAGGGFPRGGT
jgi:hypothetical protein